MELLRFRVGSAIFGMPIERVVQILERRPFTRVPDVASCIAGVFNYEGTITPLVDLHKKLELEEKAGRASIVIVSASHDDGQISIGLLVDDVVGITTVKSDAIEPVPAFGVQLRLDYLAGLTNINGAFTLIFDADRFLDAAELLDLAVAREQVPA